MPRLDDFYEVPPPEVELVGGYYDGRRMTVPDERETWYLPVPPSLELCDYDPQQDLTRPSFGIARYQRTGSIGDDGARRFRTS